MTGHAHTHACTYFVSIIELFKTKLFEKRALQILVTLGAQLRPGESVTSLLAARLEHRRIWRSQQQVSQAGHTSLSVINTYFSPPWFTVYAATALESTLHPERWLRPCVTARV